MNQAVRKHADWEKLQQHFASYLLGDAIATRQLFSELNRVLQGFFKIRLPSGMESEDLLQATLLKIHFARDRFDSTLSLKTWVFTIAARSLIDHWRGLSSETERFEPISDAEEAEFSIESIQSEVLDPAMKTELQHDLNKALEKLKPMERSIVYLYAVEGLSMAEVAKVLALTETATKLRAHRAYKELRLSLGANVFILLFYNWLLKQ